MSLRKSILIGISLCALMLYTYLSLSLFHQIDALYTEALEERIGQSYRQAEAQGASIPALSDDSLFLAGTELLTIRYQYAGLFDGSGRPLRQTELKYPDKARSVQRSVAAYLSDGADQPYRIVKIGPGYRYHAILSIPANERRIVGMELSGADILPVFTELSVTAAAFLLGPVLALLVILRVLYAKYRRRIQEARSTGLADPLTGLMNATELESALTAHFKLHPMKDYCLIALDVAAFRRFNAMFGHTLGDRLLKALGDCINECYQCGARLNGDIFLFLAPSCYEMIPKIENDLSGAIRKALGGQYGNIVAYKFGVYPLLEDEFHYREAYDGVLFALKSAKGTTRQREVVYDRNMQREVKMRKDIELHMYDALARNEFQMYIQPKFETATTKCCGGEALIRWQSEQMGHLTPDHFIPIFEENGFIAEIDFYMLQCILSFLQDLLNSGRAPYPISVNQSRITISFPDYLDRVEKLIQRYTVPLRYVELEITESAFTENFDSLIALVQSLKAMGFAVAMDDFGTGYSTLNTLRELPVDVLKLDKEFLQESDMSEKGRKIIASVLGMSRDLGIGSVCEGVETVMQLDFLRLAGCHTIQGYFLARPMPSMEFERRFIEACG